jgi:hypothetical protein
VITPYFLTNAKKVRWPGHKCGHKPAYATQSPRYSKMFATDTRAAGGTASWLTMTPVEIFPL